MAENEAPKEEQMQSAALKILNALAAFFAGETLLRWGALPISFEPKAKD